MAPYFSIIIPVYNVAPYLCECLDSVLSQTFADWEAVCIDDGSNDGSSEMLDEYAARDTRFHVIHQPNTGVGAARNVGLDVANGRWVLFLDGDDVWSARLLEKVRSMIEACPTEKLFRFGFEKFDSKFEVVPSGDKKEDTGDYEVIDISKEISMHDFFDYLFWCYAYSRGLFDGIRFPRYIRGEDRCVLNRIMLDRADAIVATDMPLYGYRIRQGSAMNSAPSRQVLLDEMDHRLDIMEMIDCNRKHVEYSGNIWLEQYFLRRMISIIMSRDGDRELLRKAWRERLIRFRVLNQLSKKAKFQVNACLAYDNLHWDILILEFIPRLKSKIGRLCRLLMPSKWKRGTVF